MANCRQRPSRSTPIADFKRPCVRILRVRGHVRRGLDVAAADREYREPPVIARDRAAIHIARRRRGGPGADGLRACQDPWSAAHRVYGQCEVSRFYNGPINAAQGAMNEWPIDESFIDDTPRT